MPHHPKKRNWYLLVGSVLIVTTLAVPLARVLLPPLHRSISLNRLISEDADERARGQMYLIRMADRDPKVIEGAIDRLSDAESGRVFLELVVTIDQIGYWTRERIPTDSWLRWLSVVARDADPEERVRAVQMLADLPDLVEDSRVQNLFTAFSADPDATVRYNALVCLAEMRGGAAARKSEVLPHYDALIEGLMNDPQSMIARHAIMMIGLSTPPTVEKIPPLKGEPDVDEAILWAGPRLRRAQPPKAAIEALNAPDAHPRTRAMAAYVLGRSESPAARDALIAFLDQGPAAVTDANQVAFWRAILALPLAPRPQVPQAGAPPVPTDDPAYAALVRFLAKCSRTDYENVHLRPLILACLFRDRWLLVDAGIKKSDIITIADDPVAWLASIEGVPQAVAQGRGAPMKLQPPDDVHEQIRLAIVRAMADPTPQDILPLLSSERATIRDQACILAAQRLTPDQNAALVRRLLAPMDRNDPLKPVFRYDDGAKFSAAIIAGLTGVEPALLDRTARDFAGRPGIIEIVQLGLWMQGRPVPDVPDMDRKARQLLIRSDLPASTILLALLHQNDPIALEHLLTPRGDQNPKLLPLLDEDRWWHVLEHFLPKDAPRLWVWADNDLARFQLDLLRDWYVLNRHRLRSEAANINSHPQPR